MDPSWGSKSWKQIHANWTLERDIGAYSIEVQIGSNAVFFGVNHVEKLKTP